MRREPKNPRRQAGQYRAMIRRQRRACYWMGLFWLLPLIGAVACFRYDAHPFLTFVAILAVIAGTIQHIDAFVRLRQWQGRLEELEGQIEADS